ncbi:MAG: amino acid adenylation domain-containing protein [Armatimonadaceae bacterium]
MLLETFFDDAARRWPDAIALDIPPPFGEEHPRVRLTYGELHKSAANIHACLTAMGVERGDIVAILTPRTNPLAYAAQLAINRLGAAFVAMDPTFPAGHIERILTDATPTVVITDETFANVLNDVGYPSARVMTNETPMNGTFPQPPVVAGRETSDLAYLIYTSGTTGLPKGVMIPHAGISNLVASDIEYFDIGPGDRCAQGSSLSYDSSLEEIWLAWAVGGTVVVMSDEIARLGPDLVTWLQTERISVLCPPPTLLRTMGCDNPAEALPDLRIIYVGGEALPIDVVDAWAPGRRLVNGYGPTECSVTATRAEILPGVPVVIGKPVSNLVAHILDDALKPVQLGDSGELCIAGPGLALGYRNRPELTSEKFVTLPEVGRVYRTGDLARILPNGDIDCMGRIDAQIKLRGYRIELEAIEAELVRCPGILEAACRVQGSGGREELAAWVVTAVDDFEFSAIRDQLTERLPFYMVPSCYGRIDALPRTVGGKVKRDALAENAPPLGGERPVIPASTDVEIRLVDAAAIVLDIPAAMISVDADFFLGCGGTSLLAAKWVSRLRQDALTAGITVRDIYEARTIRDIALRITPNENAASDAQLPADSGEHVRQFPLLISLLQGMVLLTELVSAALGAAWLASFALPAINLPPVTLAITIPLMGIATTGGWACLMVLRAVVLKWFLIGRYTAGDTGIWTINGFRIWLVMHAVRQIPWGLVEGTCIVNVILRMLGARIGKGVHFHRGSLRILGGWDLLTIGDDAVIGQDAALELLDLERSCYVIGDITLGSGASVGTRAVIDGGATLGDHSYVAPLSVVTAEAGSTPQRTFQGIPAMDAGPAPGLPLTNRGQAISEASYAALKVAASTAIGTIETAAGIISIWLCSRLLGINLVALLDSQKPDQLLVTALCTGLAAVAALPLILVFEGLLARFLGAIPEGSYPLRSIAFLRIWLTSGLVDSANRWLSGSLFWPLWLRIAGMRIGRSCEISTLVDLVPQMVTFDALTFCADGIYMGTPLLLAGSVTIGPVHIREDSFFGNHAVVMLGTDLPRDVLFGVCTVVEPEKVTAGSSWFGIPGFALPRREIVNVDASLTYEPDALRYTTRLFWELLRFTVPAIPAGISTLWLGTVVRADIQGVLIAGIGVPAALAGIVLMLKWLLLGKVKPGVHPLWSCWCSRWDFLYVLWTEWALPALLPLEGTLWLNVYLRLMGMKIGKRVALSGGFSQVVDPDMISIGDDATVSAIFQAHTFEDRVLKIDKVTIGPGATLGHGTVPLYGANIGAGTHVTTNSVIMKEETLLPGRTYTGAPCRAVGPARGRN